VHISNFKRCTAVGCPVRLSESFEREKRSKRLNDVGKLSDGELAKCKHAC